MIRKLTALSVMISAMVLASPEVFAQMSIRDVRLEGSGCGPASAQAIITPDGQTLSILFDRYSAEIGEGSENPRSRSIKRDCKVRIDVNVPFGTQYSIQQMNYRGFAALPASAFGYHRFTQILSGQAVPSLREAQLKGPMADNYEVIVASKPGRSPWSTCNNAVQRIDLLSELMVSYFPNSRDTTMAQISLDSADMATASQFKLIWRSCR